MSKQKKTAATHTPGPWGFQEGDKERRGSSTVHKASDKEFTIAHVTCESLNVAQREEDIANARLIAVAPELLAACEQSLSLSQHADGCRWWNIPVTTMNDSERSQAEQREACNCHLKACRDAIAKCAKDDDMSQKDVE